MKSLVVDMHQWMVALPRSIVRKLRLSLWVVNFPNPGETLDHFVDADTNDFHEWVFVVDHARGQPRRGRFSQYSGGFG